MQSSKLETEISVRYRLVITDVGEGLLGLLNKNSDNKEALRELISWDNTYFTNGELESLFKADNWPFIIKKNYVPYGTKDCLLFWGVSGHHIANFVQV